jgi:hypothetical protein
LVALARQKLAQLPDARCDPPGLIVREHVRLPGLVLVAAEIGEATAYPLAATTANACSSSRTDKGVIHDP